MSLFPLAFFASLAALARDFYLRGADFPPESAPGGFAPTDLRISAKGGSATVLRAPNLNVNPVTLYTLSTVM